MDPQEQTEPLDGRALQALAREALGLPPLRFADERIDEEGPTRRISVDAMIPIFFCDDEGLEPTLTDYFAIDLAHTRPAVELSGYPVSRTSEPPPPPPARRAAWPAVVVAMVFSASVVVCALAFLR
jgi:hypothetical protein